MKEQGNMCTLEATDVIHVYRAAHAQDGWCSGVAFKYIQEL